LRAGDGVAVGSEVFSFLMHPNALLGLLQFSDGLFPAGGFAHSFGLETYVQAEAIQTADDVKGFIRTFLEGSAGPCDAVAVVAALSLGHAGNFEDCLRLDAILDAMKPVAEFREASRQMGRQSLRIAARLFSHCLVSDFFACAEENQTSGHHAVAFGLIGSQLGWPPEAAATAYLYAATALLVGAALRLLPIGQLEGQKIISAMAPTITRLAGETKEKGIGDLSSFIPGIEIAGMKHATLEARLFRS
jgi:urease accessory protein